MKIEQPSSSAQKSKPVIDRGRKPTSSLSGQSSSLISSLFSSTVPGTPIAGTSMVTIARPKAKAIVVLHGLDGSGKTTFVTRFCPDPITLINCDRRAEEAAYSDAENYGRTINYLDAALPADIADYSPEDSKALAEYILYDRIKPDLIWSLNNGVRTIGLDTAFEYTRILNYAFRGHPIKQKPTKEDPGDFGAADRAINEEIWWLVNKIRENRNVNLVILSRSKEEHDGQKPLGTYRPDCHKIFHQACDWSGFLSLTSEEEMTERLLAESGTNSLTTSQMRKIKTRRPFELKITKGGQAIEEMGKTYGEGEWGEDGPFAYSCSRLIPRTTVEDWK